VKAILRAAALRVPSIRRLHAYAVQQARENQELAAALAVITTRAAETGDEQHLLGELAAAAEERDALELQLYVLRSDNQRAVVRNQEIGAALLAAEARVKQLLAAERAPAAVTAHELSLLYGKLAGRMTLLSSEIARLSPRPTASGDATTLYLDLLERALTGTLGEDTAMPPLTKGYDPELCPVGRDSPCAAQTIIGLARMRNLRVLAERVIREGIPGDFLEAGTWRGGACILMRGVLAAHGICDRTVWVADSFADLPVADPATHSADAGDQHSAVDALRISSDQAQANFRRYNLLDRQVRFLKGRFAEPVPTEPVAHLAILRVDGDKYASTIQTLDALYDRVSPGGYVIADEYLLAGCRQAVDDFRDRHDIHDELNDVDGAAVFWRKT
jgi:Macrocin-O-methyltransferase (TylF)